MKKTRGTTTAKVVNKNKSNMGSGWERRATYTGPSGTRGNNISEK